MTRACLLAVVAGTVAFAWGALGGQAPRAFAALIASWLFFSGAAMGTLAFGAVLELSGARWADGLNALASAVTSFVPVAMLLLVLIVAGVPSWAPWFDRPPSGQAFWLNLPFFSVRELLSTAKLRTSNKRQRLMRAPKRGVLKAFLQGMSVPGTGRK